ncbi:MAG: protein phosphatase CheZ [Rhizomicrobium sp.]|jgi:chemotaxis protein CheZ
MSSEDTCATPLHIDNAQSYLDRLIRELHALGTEKKQPLVTVLEYLSQHIRLTREEIGALKPSGENFLMSTADELEEIVAETARAANEIMGAAESVEAVAVGTDPKTREALQVAATRIYEASAFQDITGQRITKVVRALQHIEARIEALAHACGDSLCKAGDQALPVGDAALLSGPQLMKNAATQSDIDSLFDSLGGPQ